MATIRALVERDAEVHVVHWDDKKLTPYQPSQCKNVYMYKRSEINAEEIHRLVKKLSPSITVISGWQDRGYLKVAKRLRSQGEIVVSGFDGQWYSTLRQRTAAMLGGLGYFSSYYSHAWVAGFYQFEYARRLGFSKTQIIYDLYSADLNLFQKAYQNSLRKKRKCYPHRFLFVGRFELIKGLDTLLKAWQVIGSSRDDWELLLIGNGSLKTTLLATPGVTVKDFMQPEQLIEEVTQAGCFVLPSRDEPWGVVAHEFAAAGMPLILSNVVGAASTFLIPGLNGYSFTSQNAEELAQRMLRIIDSSDQELLTMGLVSYQLSHRISPQTSAANLLSIMG